MNARTLLALASLALAPAAFAGTCNDPWVTKAIQEVTGRAPTGSGNSGDCNIQNYGNGQWSSYQDLVGKVRAATRTPAPAPVAQQGVCTDPWVTRAVQEVAKRPPNGSAGTGECSIQRYGNGHWTSYEDLVGKVKVAFGVPVAAPMPAPVLPPVAAVPGLIQTPAAGIVANNGARLATPGSAGMVSAGGNNVIGQNGANVVSNNGANVIGQNGANVVSNNGANIVAPNGARVQGNR